ncbi:TetR/AcrR family transcriptional regulator [Seonamhaeicola marinus]|uniref:TetR/AcrR family transcriptional regulator n=1 Tax=Seonamhaeicola marinus TaxID=1912246 RepID=A0A5D0HSQ0_9FLAO|nr:TetR/AcrR family transcriptional regulator [Seonamhaeicola marinus]TYA74000.1 TetR/AcrR family transcriptional regulator [Seonamhaeicola marinus]
MGKTAKHDAKADYLLEKGMEILWFKGYNATSVNDIVKAAEVPKGSFYFYFESKEDFVVKAIDKYFGMMFTPANEILQDKTKSPKERLLAFNAYRIAELKEQLNCKMGCMVCNISNEMSEHSENIRRAIVVKMDYMIATIAQIVQEAKDLGEITNPMSAEDIAAFIEDAGRGAMVRMKEMKSGEPIDNAMYVIENMLLK